jgi:glycosyltransferase involved in cell wall biosynthesis
MTKIKKIILSSNSSWNIYNFRIPLIEELNKTFEVLIVSGDDLYTKKLKNLGYKVVNINISESGTSIFADLLLIIQYYKILNKYKPDYFFGFTIKPNIYFNISSFFSKVKNINTITGLGTAFLNNNYLNFFITKLYKFSLIKSQYVIFQNSDDLSLFINKKIILNSKAKIINGSGVDINFFKFTINHLNKPKNYQFLYIGRLIFDKGLKELIEAIVNIKKRYPQIKFNFIGSFSSKNLSSINKEYVYQLNKKKLINYIGYKEDVRKDIENSNCVILPSYREGLPKSLLEAASMGRPIIASNVPGCKEIVIDKYNGFLCKVKDSIDLEKKILDFINLDKKKIIEMGINSRKLVENKFQQNIIMKSYLNLIN